MLYTTLDEYDMKRMLERVNRDNFSYHALRAYIAFAEGLGENIEFDPVGFDCSFIEFDLSDEDDINTFIHSYGYLVEGEKFADENSKIEKIMQEIEDNTLVISSCNTCFVFDYNF